MNFCNEYLFIMISFSTAVNWEKKLFFTNKLFVFYYSNWEKFVEKISETNWWNYLMNSLLVNKFDNLPFTKNDENFVEAFAIFCGMGIHNVHMYEKTVLAMAKQQVTLEVLR